MNVVVKGGVCGDRGCGRHLPTQRQTPRQRWPLKQTVLECILVFYLFTRPCISHHSFNRVFHELPRMLISKSVVVL